MTELTRFFSALQIISVAFKPASIYRMLELNVNLMLSS